MHGNNPIRPPVKGDGSTLDIERIFPTFQGEGPYTGWPAVFIRLGGCNLACNFCDTEFESFASQPLEDILEKADQLSGRVSGEITRNLIVITGGEPFRQPLALLCDALLERGYKVQIETNGILYQSLDERVEIVCSPKNTGTGYHRIREDLLPRINAFKFIVSEGDPLYNSVDDVGQEDYNTPVYVQPMDEYNETKNKRNTELAVRLAAQYGYRLSLQTHKIAGVQ